MTPPSEELKVALPELRNAAKNAMMAAHSFCPLGLPHTERMKWMADYFMKSYGQAYALQAVEAERRDAERYRWLRAQQWDNAALCVVAHPKAAVRLGHDCPSLERLDELVDGAIKEQNNVD